MCNILCGCGGICLCKTPRFQCSDTAAFGVPRATVTVPSTASVMAMTWAWGFELSGSGVCMFEQQFGDSATGQRGGSPVTWLKIG